VIRGEEEGAVIRGETGGAGGPRPSALEFLGRLAGGLVHEIKNPLSTLRINLTLLKEDLAEARPEARALRKRIEVLENEVSRLDAVLSDFLRYAGMRRLEKQPCDLRALVAGMVEFLEPGFRREGIDLRADVPPLPVEVDAALFKRALLNLLLNAQQAIEGGGKVVLTGAAEGAFARLEVRDDGKGIPADELERVFDVYYSRSKAGSGLGLPTARRILEEHGGQLELASREGQGTVVTLRLPLRALKAIPGSEALRESEASPGSEARPGSEASRESEALPESDAHPESEASLDSAARREARP
jgi:signal transduction histidine kinase